MKSIYLLVFNDPFSQYKIYKGFCFESYGEAATYLNEVKGMFTKTGIFGNRNGFYLTGDDNNWASIIEVPITKNKLERKGWWD